MQSGIPLNAPPYDARALANSILQDAYQFNIDLYSTSMLKILYFAHGWYLARFNTPLIGQPFEAWKHGPVIRVIYDQLKGMSGRKIERRFEIFDAVTKQYIAPEAHLTDADRSFIKFMLRAYSQFHPYELSEMTHEVNSPWHKVWEAGSGRSAIGMRIPNKFIREYFLTLNESDIFRSS
ncbi:Panacea domain-containing protein [Brucella grignonensis]|uniref:Panacea domain-containing protein n=1 Tax=Brucella grignonensis TaxID=94627 RepID=UPI001F3E7A9E|nr:type II toxin-antitoxin system antitoxin SocA domain-containing protein [Brucella grignonensis]